MDRKQHLDKLRGSRFAVIGLESDCMNTCQGTARCDTMEEALEKQERFARFFCGCEFGIFQLLGAKSAKDYEETV